MSYARYWLADGREVRNKIGPAWTARGRPPAGCFTKRTAPAWLSDVPRPGAARNAAGRGPYRRNLRRRRRPSTCATSRSTAAARRPRCTTTARSSTRTCYRPFATRASRTSRRRRSSAGSAPSAANHVRPDVPLLWLVGRVLGFIFQVRPRVRTTMESLHRRSWLIVASGVPDAHGNLQPTTTATEMLGSV